MSSEPANNPAENRYEMQVEGRTAYAAYKLHDAVITFTHTIVPKELGGRGIATKLIGFALADVREKGLRVIPQCPFVAAYIEKHPEERDLLA
ncbi:GNAT family N-acetyltransferase [Sphingomonas sp. G-3-2-10]|uniref:GNAT family N-acetyltransferase n=1 Tax=Sphingomonas sp. G-3-2-10 TaxID=2728838 RepID=UPI00146BBED4|nr:GNAT family N-acetyltransferase [Sphingomonas sp. G-3-2-10]NML07280.1 N-acetyltransferase [Sphingomonas sp. G-3-2-10]